MRRLTFLLALTVGATAQVTSRLLPKSGAEFSAAAFGQWTLTTRTPVPTAGVATVVLTPGQLTLPDSGSFEPLLPAVPVLVHDGAATETVTPTQAACVPASCTLTANFVNAHPSGFTVTSSTAGLNEAIQAAKASGGTVVLGPDWYGTTAQIATAVGSNNVAIEDLRRGASVTYVWTASGYVQAFGIGADGGLTARSPAITPTSLEGVVYADQFCATPGTLDQTCINNAILSLGSTNWPSPEGTIFIPAGTYVLHAPVISHRNITLIFDQGALLEDDGTADFSCTSESHCIGMMRFCQTKDCSGSPVTPGEQNMIIIQPHFRITQNRTVAFNGYGFSDSVLNNLWVDSSTFSYSAGLGTCAVFDAASATGSGDFRNTIVEPRCWYVAQGIVMGGFGLGNAANSNTIVGGFLQGNPALDIENGSGNSIFGTNLAGNGAQGGVLVKLGAGTQANSLNGAYFDDGLAVGNTATAVAVAAGAIGNMISNIYLDGEGGTLASGQATDAGTDTTWLPRSGNGDTVFGGSGNLFFSQTCSATRHIVFGSKQLPTAMCFGLSSPNLVDGVEFNNTHSASTSAQVGINVYFQNSAAAKTNFGSLAFTPTTLTAGSETGHWELDSLLSGTMVKGIGCAGYSCDLPGSLAVDTSLSVGGKAVVVASQLPLPATTSVITVGALAAGTCYVSAAVAVSGATTSMAAVASPQAALGSGFTWSAWVDAAGSVKFTVCNATLSALTPTATAWNVRVIQ